MCRTVNTRVDAGRLSNEGAIDAKPGSTSLLAGILFEHIDRQSLSSEADSGRKSGERPAYDCYVTSQGFRHIALSSDLL
jgi:hypothetical protein